MAARTTAESAVKTEVERAPARRPRVVLVDVFDTMLRVDALGSRFVDLGRPAEEYRLFFARTLRDGMAFTLSGAAPPFGDVARAALRTLAGPGLSPEAVEHVLGGLRELPPHPDVEPALLQLTRARVPCTRSPTVTRRWPRRLSIAPVCAPTCARCCRPRR